MRGAIKFIMTAIGLVLIGIAVAAILLSSQVEAFAKEQAATSLGRYYGAEAEIGGMRLVPLEQGVELTDVVVYNPEPFDREAAVSCERLVLKPDLATIFSPKPELNEVAIEGAVVALRYDVGKGTNLGALLDRAAQREADRESLGADRRVIVVRNCHSGDAKVTLTSNALLDLPFTIDVAPFSIDEVNAGEPVPAWKTASLFLKTILWETVSAKGLFKPVAEGIRQELGAEQEQ